MDLFIRGGSHTGFFPATKFAQQLKVGAKRKILTQVQLVNPS
jgi:hypothetical protein